MVDEFCDCPDCEKHREIIELEFVQREQLNEERRIEAMSHTTMLFTKLTFWQRLQIRLAPILRVTR